MISFEYMAVAVCNHFLENYNEIATPAQPVYDVVIEIIEYCLDKKLDFFWEEGMPMSTSGSVEIFVKILCELLEKYKKIDWFMIVLLLAYLVQTLKLVSGNTRKDSYSFVLAFQMFAREAKVTQWVLNQPEEWESLLVLRDAFCF